MTDRENQSFADEASTLSGLLQQAQDKLKCLQELHEAEVREAVDDSASKKQESKLAAAKGQKAPDDPRINFHFEMLPFAVEQSSCSFETTEVGEFKVGEVSNKPETDVEEGQTLTAGQTMRTPVSQSTKASGLRPIWEYSRSSCELMHGLEIIRNETFASIGPQVHHYASMFSSTFATRASSVHIRSICFCCCGVLHPIGTFRLLWNLASLLMVLYDFVLIPASAFRIEDLPGVEVCEWIVTIFWTFDIWLSFRTGYLMGMHVEMRPKKIAVQYAKSWLTLDLSIVILEWTTRLLAGLASASLLKAPRVWQTFKILKVFRLGRLGKLSRMRSALQDRVDLRTLNLAFSIAVLLCSLLLLLHCAACIWYAVGDQSKEGWTTKDGYEDESSGIFFYVASFRWVVAQINGRTDIKENRNMVEMLFTCGTGISLGIFYQAVFISFVTKTMLDLNELFSEQARRQRFVRAYLEIYPLPPVLTMQVRSVLNEYKDVGKELQKEREFMTILPARLQTDVLFEVRSHLLHGHHFFSHLLSQSSGVMRLVCQHVVQPVTAAKGEIIFDKGDVCCRMLFLDKITAMYGEPTDFDFIPSSRSPQHTMSLSRLSRSKNEVSDRGELELENKSLIATWISEPALWIEWNNQGRLVSNGHGLLFEIEAANLAEIFKQDQYTLALATTYAKSIADELDENPIESDILPFKVEWSWIEKAALI